MFNKCLHKLPKYISKSKQIQVGNGQFVSILFIIPIVVQIGDHLFEIYTSVSEIHDNIDLVIGLKNMFEIEANLNTRDSACHFLNRSVPIFPKERTILKPKETKFVKIEMPFTEELSGMGVVKLLDKEAQGTATFKVKIVRNQAIFEIVNVDTKPIVMEPKEHIGILDIRSMRYYKISHDVMQQQLSHMYHFENLYEICDSFNKIVNEHREEIIGPMEDKKKEDPYPWLQKDDIRRNMTDEEILFKFISLEESCLNHSGKKKLLNMLIKNKQAFSLRDEIGTCPNITVDIEFTDKEPFFIRPYNISEEDKPIMDREMKGWFT